MTDPPGHDLYEATLVEIGRITTTWAKFEHWIDQAIWALAKLHDREGACITSQINSIHGKFRALQAPIEAQRPENVQSEVASIAGEAAKVVQLRNKFAHGPLDMGHQFRHAGSLDDKNQGGDNEAGYSRDLPTVDCCRRRRHGAGSRPNRVDPANGDAELSR